VGHEEISWFGAKVKKSFRKLTGDRTQDILNNEETEVGRAG
jgi:hypothetical protein